MPNEIYKNNILISPNEILRRFDILREKYGQLFLKKKNCFKHERESWITAIFALALKEGDDPEQEYWIGIESIEQTPDTYIINYFKKDQELIKGIRYIEVVEWEEHVENIVDIIKKKSAKAYPRFYFLLIYARGGVPERKLDYREISKKLQGLNIPFSEIIIVTTNVSHYGNCMLFWVHPEIRLFEFNAKESYTKNTAQARYLKELPGKNIEKTNSEVIPLPECN